MIELNKLVTLDIGEVLASPDLKGAVLSYTRNLFYGGQIVRSCESSLRNYFRRLQLEGLQTQKIMENQKYQLKKDVVIMFNGQKYNASEMTDAVAEDYLAKFPKAKEHFIIKNTEKAPENQPEAKAPVKRGPKAK